MLEKFLAKTSFDSYEDFMQNFHVNVPDNFNFGYDVVDEWALHKIGAVTLPATHLLTGKDIVYR